MKNIIDLLTIEEAEKLPIEILQCKAPKDFNGYINEGNGNCCWWLRSPSRHSCSTIVVLSYGTVCASGINVNNDYCTVRPALRTAESLIETLPRTKKGYVIYLGTKWIDISEYVGSPCLLKKKCLRKARRFDSESNDYDKSEIKDFIEDWYKRKVNNNTDNIIKKFIIESIILTN